MDMNALKNGIFSFIIPGLGQYILKDQKRGLTLLAGAIILHLAIWFFMNNPAGSLINTLYHAYAGYDAYKKS